MLYLSRRASHADRFDASGYGSAGTTTTTTLRPYGYGNGIKNRTGHSPPNSARAAVRSVTGDRRSAPGPTPEPFGATAGSMPIKTLAAQIWAFCAAASR
jgi:cellulase/cellobiase CelA1